MEIIPKITLHYVEELELGYWLLTYLYFYFCIWIYKNNEDSDFLGLLVIKYLFDRCRKIDLCVLFRPYPRLIVSEFSFISHIHRCPHTWIYIHSKNISSLTRHYWLSLNFCFTNERVYLKESGIKPRVLNSYLVFLRLFWSLQILVWPIVLAHFSL